MASQRRLGAESSRTRALLIEATEQLMREEGYVAVSARRVAERAGLKPQLVHYYFRSMDELLLAVFRRFAERYLVRQEDALASDRPVSALWQLYTDTSIAGIVFEFVALANHRATVRDEIGRSTEMFRASQSEELARAMQRVGANMEILEPSAITLLMLTISTTLMMESGLGVETGHAALKALVQSHIDKVEGKAGPLA
ncbi:MAG: TetR/AcrR family transcriptional regulator [Sphingomonadales bacterium]|nr:MAG: TetR/AcrR family transcriptional regulator [Sphingomonadales bacterium]